MKLERQFAIMLNLAKLENEEIPITASQASREFREPFSPSLVASRDLGN